MMIEKTLIRIARDLFALCLLSFFGTTAALAQASESATSWPRQTLPLHLGNPDLSYLNHRPAGRLGRVKAKGEELVFDTGETARFWGLNLQASALFETTPANIRAHARRIASLGFNLVRIHHHDSHWVTPNIFGRQQSGTRQLDTQSLAMLDRWIEALKAEGVYIWLDLHVGRRMTAADDIWTLDEIADDEGRADIRGYSYVSDSIQDRMLEFQQAYISHVNSLSGLSYAADPAIIAVLVTNENDVTAHFGNALLPDKNVPAHSALFMARAEDFARNHGLDPDKTWRSWEFGPSRLFLNDLEHRFNQRMIANLRQAGFEGLIATTSTWGEAPVSSLPALTDGSIIDVHSYAAPGVLTTDPRAASGFIDWVAAAQVPGLPLTISEWNIVDFPAEDRFVGALRMATSAAYQGWDAPMIYGYAQRGLNEPLLPSNWAIAFDPAILSMMPASALLYRQGHVAPARKTYALRIPAASFFGEMISPDASAALRGLAELGRVTVEIPETPELPWLTPRVAGPDAIGVMDLSGSLVPEGASALRSDTGEVVRDFVRGLLTVDTPRSQIAVGQLTGGAIALADITVDSGLTAGAVAVQSLDGQPISASGKIMISLTARATPLAMDQVAYAVEPLAGEISIAAPAELTLKTGSGGDLPEPGAHRFEGTRHIIDLSRLGGYRWLLLE
jgi:hypothetical protein